MPYKLERPCKNTLCSNTTNNKSGYCNKHQIKDGRIRDKRYYSKRWKEYCKAFLNVYKKCIKCGDSSTEVDHVKRVDSGGDFWDSMNHQALCHSCHSKKTASEIQFGKNKKYTYEEIYGRKRR